MGMSHFAREALRTFCFALAALAAAGTVLIPIPAKASNAARVSIDELMLAKARVAHLDLAMVAGKRVPIDLLMLAKARAAQLASQDTIGVLTRQQIIEFGRSHPAFVAKIKHAYQTGVMPQFTAEEQALIDAATQGALGNMKAGSYSFGPLGGSGIGGRSGSNNNAAIAIVIVALVVLFLIFGWFFNVLER